MDNKIKYTGAVLALILSLAGGSVYYVTIKEESIVVAFEDATGDCSVLELTITESTVNKLKCGRYIIGEWDSILLHDEDGYVNSMWEMDFRKTSKTQLFIINETPDYFTIRKITEYYKGRTGSDGILTEDYKFTKEGIKWSYNLQTVNSNKHYIVLRMNKFHEKYNFLFYHDDPFGNFVYMEDNEYFYGGVSGDFVVDPLIEKIPDNAIIIREDAFIKTNYNNITNTEREFYSYNIKHPNGSLELVSDYNEVVKSKLIDTGVNEVSYGGIKFNDSENNLDCNYIDSTIICYSTLDLDSYIKFDAKGISNNLFDGNIKNKMKKEGII